MTYLETHSTNPTYNLAFEEWVLTHLAQGEYLILWQNDNTVVIGQNQNALEEINAAFVREHGVHVVRRTTGGGAVYHDLGNLNFSFITDYDSEKGTNMSRFTSLVVNALKSLGVEAASSGRNDILVDGKKVSGSAQRIVTVKAGQESKQRILYHGTLLFRSDPDMIAGALHADPLKFTSKSTKSVRSRVGNIADYLSDEMNITDFWNALRSTLERQQIGAYKESCFCENEAVQAGAGKHLTEGPEMISGRDPAQLINFTAIKKLQTEKYESYDWTYGRSPAFSFQKKKRYPGGTLELRLLIEKGLIQDAVIYGDFLSLSPTDSITDRLKKIPYTKAAVEQALAEIDFGRILGSISREEFLDTIF